jgi:hypothetical protein
MELPDYPVMVLAPHRRTRMGPHLRFPPGLFPYSYLVILSPVYVSRTRNSFRFPPVYFSRTRSSLFFPPVYFSRIRTSFCFPPVCSPRKKNLDRFA